MIFVAFLASLFAIVVLIAVSVRFSRSSLNDLWGEESWAEPVEYASLAALAAIIFSFVNLRVVDYPVPISLNVTGVLIPLVMTALIVALRKIRIIDLIISSAIVTFAAFFLAEVGQGSIVLAFPLWLIAFAIVAACGYLVSEKKDLVSTASLAYASGSIGMFVGGDLLNMGPFISAGREGLVLGAAGILDFVFLSGIIAIAMLWGAQGFIALRNSASLRAKESSVQ